MNKTILISIVLFINIFYPGLGWAQSVKASISLGIASEKRSNYTNHFNLGTDVRIANDMHGITYKLSFDPNVVYADSVFIHANSEQLELRKDEYFEMQRTDSTFVLYSLTLKGREKSLKLEELPISIDFAIKPETQYELIANNCQYTVEFKAESVTAYDRSKSEIELDPFVLPINIECEEGGETTLLLAAPNPTKERCWIHIPPEKIEGVKKVLLFSTNGKHMDSDFKKFGDEIELNVSHLRAGHYYLNIIYNNEEKDVVKIVKI